MVDHCDITLRTNKLLGIETLIKALTLDLWGTLVYDEPGPLETYTLMELEAMRRALSRNKPLELNQVIEVYTKLKSYKGIIPPRLFAKMMIILLGYESNKSIAEKAAEAYIEGAYGYRPRVVPGTNQLLEYVKKAGIKTAVVSNTHFSARAVAKILENVGLLQYIDYIVSSADVGIMKPNPRIFNIALKALNSKPEDAMHLGDSCTRDVLGAYLAGVSAILIAKNDVSIKLCENVPRLIIVRNLEEALEVLKNLTK